MVINNKDSQKIFLTKGDIKCIKSKEPLLVEIVGVELSDNDILNIIKERTKTFKLTLSNGQQVNISRGGEIVEYVISSQGGTPTMDEKKEISQADLKNVLLKSDILDSNGLFVSSKIPTISIDKVSNLSKNLTTIEDSIKTKASTTEINTIKNKVGIIFDDNGNIKSSFFAQAKVPTIETISNFGVITDNNFETKLTTNRTIDGLTKKTQKLDTDGLIALNGLPNTVVTETNFDTKLSANRTIDGLTKKTQKLDTDGLIALNGLPNTVVTETNFDTKLSANTTFDGLTKKTKNLDVDGLISTTALPSSVVTESNFSTKLSANNTIKTLENKTQKLDTGGLISINGLPSTVQQKSNYYKCNNSTETGKEWNVNNGKLSDDSRNEKVENRLYTTTREESGGSEEVTILKYNGDVIDTKTDQAKITKLFTYIQTMSSSYYVNNKEWCKTNVLDIMKKAGGNVELNNEGKLIDQETKEILTTIDLKILVKYLNILHKTNYETYKALTENKGYDCFEKIIDFLTYYYITKASQTEPDLLSPDEMVIAFENMMTMTLTSSFKEKLTYKEFYSGELIKRDEYGNIKSTFGPINVIQKNAEKFLELLVDYYQKKDSDFNINNILAFDKHQVLGREENTINVDGIIYYPIRIEINPELKPQEVIYSETYTPKVEPTVTITKTLKTSTYDQGWVDSNSIVAFVTDKYIENESTYWHVEYRKFTNNEWLETGEENIISESEPTSFANSSELTAISERINTLRGLVVSNKELVDRDINSFNRIINGDDNTADNKLSRMMATFNNDGSISSDFGVSKTDWNYLVNSMSDASSAIVGINDQITSINSDIATHNTNIENIRSSVSNQTTAINNLIAGTPASQQTEPTTTPTTTRTYTDRNIDTTNLVRKTIS